MSNEFTVGPNPTWLCNPQCYVGVNSSYIGNRILLSLAKLLTILCNIFSNLMSTKYRTAMLCLHRMASPQLGPCIQLHNSIVVHIHLPCLCWWL